MHGLGAIGKMQLDGPQTVHAVLGLAPPQVNDAQNARRLVCSPLGRLASLASAMARFRPASRVVELSLVHA